MIVSRGVQIANQHGPLKPAWMSVDHLTDLLDDHKVAPTLAKECTPASATASANQISEARVVGMEATLASEIAKIAKRIEPCAGALAKLEVELGSKSSTMRAEIAFIEEQFGGKVTVIEEQIGQLDSRILETQSDKEAAVMALSVLKDGLKTRIDEVASLREAQHVLAHHDALFNDVNRLLALPGEIQRIYDKLSEFQTEKDRLNTTLLETRVEWKGRVEKLVVVKDVARLEESRAKLSEELKTLHVMRAELAGWTGMGQKT
jgi:hypothetical protein